MFSRYIKVSAFCVIIYICLRRVKASRGKDQNFKKFELRSLLAFFNLCKHASFGMFIHKVYFRMTHQMLILGLRRGRPHHHKMEMLLTQLMWRYHMRRSPCPKHYYSSYSLRPPSLSLSRLSSNTNSR